MTATTNTRPLTSGSAAPAKPPSSPGERRAGARGLAQKDHTFRAVLAERGGVPETRVTREDAPVHATGLPPSRGRRGRSDDPPEREPPEPRTVQRPLPADALREPGPASFGAPAPGVTALPLTGGGAVAEPAVLAAVAERVLRSLRVGTDAQGRSLVQLEVAEGPLAGCRVQLRRVAGGVAVEVRDHAGAPDAREDVVIEALRRRGIEVV